MSQAWRPQRNRWDHRARGKPWPSSDGAGSASSPLQINADLPVPFLVLSDLKRVVHVTHARCGKVEKIEGNKIEVLKTELV